MRRVHRHAAVAVAAADTAAVVVSAEVPWVASAEVTSVVSAEATWAVSAELTREVLAELIRRAWAEIIMAMEDIVTAAAFTTTAIAARITRHMTGPTPAPTEW